MSKIEKEAPQGATSRRRNHSLFGPVVLIALGVYLLLNNLGQLPDLNWWSALRFWPLLLIFLGLNIIVRQAPRPFGGLLSALVGVMAVGTFGWLLVAGEDNAVIAQLGLDIPEATYQTEEISFTGEDVETAVVRLDFSSPGADVYALEDSRDLIDGSVTYTGDLVFDTEQNGREASVFLDTRSQGGWWFFGGWPEFNGDDRWQIGLSPDVAMDLRLDLSSGAANIDLAALTLSELEVDASSGRVEMALPAGAYDVRYEASSGAADIVLPSSGELYLDVDASSGRMVFTLPSEMEARVEVVDASSGALNLSERFALVEGERGEEGVWETDGYGRADNRVELILDMSSGSITIDGS